MFLVLLACVTLVLHCFSMMSFFLSDLKTLVELQSELVDICYRTPFWKKKISLGYKINDEVVAFILNHVFR